MNPPNQLRIWLNAAKPEERETLASMAGTTVGTLNQVAGGYRRKGAAVVRAGLARRLEQAANFLRRGNRALPELYRTDLAPECKDCDFAQRCLGNKTAISDFSIIED